MHYQLGMVQAAQDLSATEETGALPTTTEGSGRTPKAPAREFLYVARRNLTEAELASPGVQRFMIAEIERLDQLCAEHEGIITQYHDQRVTIATLTEQTKSVRWNQILFVMCLSVGSAGIG